MWDLNPNIKSRTFHQLSQPGTPFWTLDKVPILLFVTTQ